MRNKKGLGNPLLIAAGTKIAADTVSNEIALKRQRNAEKKEEQRKQQQQDELAANQIYAKQAGVDLVAASYLRRRRNRRIAYAVVGIGVITIGAVVALRAYKLSKVSEEARDLAAAIPPGLMENKAINTLLRSILFGLYPPSLTTLKEERIRLVIELAQKVKDFEQLKKNYKTLTRNSLEKDITEKCSADTWKRFENDGIKAAQNAKSGVVQANDAINSGGEIKKDETSYNEDNKNLYVILNKHGGRTYVKSWKSTPYSLDLTPSDATFQDYALLGITTGEAIKYDAVWGWGESFHTIWKIKPLSGNFVEDTYVFNEDVVLFKEKQQAIDFINAKTKPGTGELYFYSPFSGIQSKQLRCIANTSIDGKLVLSGQVLGVLIPEQSTAQQYAFKGSNNKLYYVPKQAAAIII